MKEFKDILDFISDGGKEIKAINLQFVTTKGEETKATLIKLPGENEWKLETTMNLEEIKVYFQKYAESNLNLKKGNASGRIKRKSYPNKSDRSHVVL